jgi:hypothetical protein
MSLQKHQRRPKLTVLFMFVCCVFYQGKKFIGNARANYGRHCFGSRMPPLSSRLAAYHAVCDIGAERGIDVTGRGVYRRVTLNMEEMKEVMQKAHPSCDPVKILERFKSKITGKATCDAYYTMPKATEESNSIGWHSDPGGGCIIQIYGSKHLKIGGIHVVPAGSAGNSVALETLPADSHYRNVVLEPNAIVGFASRQIHCLTCPQEKNLSLSFAIEELL